MNAPAPDLWSSLPWTPRRWQAEAVPTLLDAMRRKQRPVCASVMGCHEAGTMLLMYDGTTKAVEDVRVGDRLMGPDSTPREVLKLCRGEAPMFEVRPTKGEPWRVNGDHVLSVIDTRSKYDGYVEDMTVHAWLERGAGWRGMRKLFRVGVDFPNPSTLPIDPYFVGVLLGDGSTRNTLAVTTMDAEIEDAVREVAATFGATVTVYQKPDNQAYTLNISYPGVGPRGDRCGHALLAAEQLEMIRFWSACGDSAETIASRLGVSDGVIDDFLRGRTYQVPRSELPLRDALEDLGLMRVRCEDKRVPHVYKVASRDDRLAILAGLIDTDGSLSHAGFDYISKSRGLSEDVAFLARSLGLAAYVSECEKSCQTGAVGTYWRVSINGHTDEVPTRLPRKQAPPRRQPKDVRRTAFDVVPLDYTAPYYGFTIDGDHRYLLADFTVTHNSGKSVALSAIVAHVARHLRPDQRIVVGTSSVKLVHQLAADLRTACGARVVGQFFTGKKQIARPVIVACYDSFPLLAERLAAAELSVLTWVADEAHKTETPDVLAAVEALSPLTRVGFTATPYRSTRGETLSAFDVLGYSYGLGDALRDGVLVPYDVVNWDGTGSDDVDDILMRQIPAHTAGPGIVSALSIEDAQQYAARLTAAGIPAAAIHSKLDRGTQDSLLSDLQHGDLRALVHVSLLTEGVDLPWLRWLACRRPVRARVRFAQEVGRVLRTMRQPDQWGNKTIATILDPHDLFGRLSLTGTAELGEAMAGLDREKPDAPEKPPEFDLPDLPGLERDMPPAVAVDAISQWARRLLLNLQAAGLVQHHDDDQEDGWRSREVTPRQLGALKKLRRWRGAIPHPHREAVEWLTDERRAVELSRGAASDLLDVLACCRNQSRLPSGGWRTWQWPSSLPIPTLEVAA